MKRKPFLHKKIHAQSMVEFALILPLLLLVVYGLLEVGRLIFTYSIVITASREAVRYGSATGLNVAGGTARYKDCAGIQAAAKNVDFLGVITDPTTQIQISYDHGPGTASFSSCPPGSVATGDRVNIQVTAPFAPIITMPIGPITVRSSTARSIIIGLSVWGTFLPPTILPLPPINTYTPQAFPTGVNTDLPTNTPNGSETPTPTATTTGTPTMTFTPSMTFTATLTPTITNTPTATATNVNCILVTHSPLQRSGNTLVMNMNNQTGAILNMAQVLVVWNNATGHTGTDTTLKLQTIAVGGAPIWGGESTGPGWVSSFLYAAGVMLPSGTSQVVFTFHQSYDVLSSTDKIMIQFYNNGCASYTLDSSASSSCSVGGAPAISDLSVSRQGSTDTLTWTPSIEDIGGTRIYQSTSSTGPWTLIKTVGSSVDTTTGRKQDGNYYKVQPINSCGNAPFSNVFQVP